MICHKTNTMFRIKDLGENTKNKVRLFADDTIFYSTITTTAGCMEPDTLEAEEEK